jgi:signal transduction histidine kinase
VTVAGEHAQRRLASILSHSNLGLAALLVSAGPAHAASGEEARLGALAAAAVAILSALMLLRQWRRRVAAEKAERARAAEAAALRAAIEAAPTALLAIDRQDGATVASRRLRRLLGLSETAAIGLDEVRRAFDAAGGDALAQALAGLSQDERPFRLTLAGATADRRFVVEGERSNRADILVVNDDSRAAAAEATARETAPLGTVVEALPIAVWSRGPDHGLATENPAARELFTLAGGDRATELPRRAHRLQRPQSESRAVVRAGQRRLFEFTEIPMPEGGTVGYATDVTALEQSQAEIARHLAAHVDVLELLGTAIAVVGPDLRLKFFNAAYARLFQFDPKWLAGEPLLGEMLEQLRDRRKLPETADFQAYKREQLRRVTGIIEAQEALMHLPDGSTLRTTVAPHPLGGAILAYEDVTDRLVLERSYNTLIEVQRETLDNLQEAIAVFGGDGLLKLRNPAFARLWSIDPDILSTDRHIGEVVELMRPLLPAQADWPAFKATMIADVFERTPQAGRLERTDGRIVDFANVPLPDGATQIVYVDVTDRARVEQALRERNEALEAADQLKSEFIANVSHELRTPLNAIIGFSEILINAYFGSLNERQGEYARGILESSKRLAALIDIILDLASIEAGYMHLERKVVEVADLVEETAALSRERARGAGIDLQTFCAPDLGRASLDHRRVRQALFNVVTNAIKYTRPGGRIGISAQRRDGAIEFSVSDTGVGIPTDDHVRVFRKFERRPVPGAATGLGLGLALVKSFVELHGGTVALESAPEKGTTVICRIPVEPPDSSNPGRTDAG